MKKWIAALICLCLMAGLLAGCGGGNSEIEYYEDEQPAAETSAAGEETAPQDAAPQDAAPAEGESAVESAAEAEGIHIGLGGTGYETYAPDTVVATVNGTEVTWMEYYYWLNSYVTQYLQLAEQYGVALTSWDAVGELSSEQSNADALIAMAQFSAEQYHVVQTEAEKLGVTLDDEDAATIASVYDSNADAQGDGDGETTDEERAAFDEFLAENHVDRALFDYLSEVPLLNDKVFIATYGEFGEKYSDEATQTFIDESGVLNAKHILLLTVDEQTREPLSEEEIAEKRATAEEIHARLAEMKDNQDALIPAFDELMNQYSEDSGLAAYPDGYIFSEGEMVPEFEEAVKALDENYGLSDIVESDYGYHIILRQPITPDTVLGQDANGEDVTLRYQAASQQYSAQMQVWMDTADVVWNEGFDHPDMQAIFG